MAQLTGAISVQVIYRSDSAVGPLYWANRYEAFSDEGIDSQQLAAAYEAFALPLLNSTYWVDHIVVGTLAQDGQPYSVDVLGVWPVNKRGLREVEYGSMLLPLNNVLLLKKYVPSGRLGSIMLRGYLTEADIGSDGNGGVSLVNPTAVQAAVDAAFANLDTATAPMAMISGPMTLTVVRPVTKLIVSRISSKSLRTKRKSRLVQNAVQGLSQRLSDGIVTAEELVPVVADIATLVKAISGTNLPPLLP